MVGQPGVHRSFLRRPLLPAAVENGVAHVPNPLQGHAHQGGVLQLVGGHQNHRRLRRNSQQPQVARDQVRRQEHGRDTAHRAAEMLHIHPNGTRNVAAIVGGLRTQIDNAQVNPAQILLQP